MRLRQAAVVVIYFTSLESRVDNAKDLLIYAMCFAPLRRLVVHLHGGAGVRELMRQRWGWLRQPIGLFLGRLLRRPSDQAISILEAYVPGRVVITTDHFGIFDTFTDEINGLVVEMRSAAALHAALAAVASDPVRLIAMALTNHRTAGAGYSTTIDNESFLKVVLEARVPAETVPTPTSTRTADS